mgnify:CR=1 FL=1
MTKQNQSFLWTGCAIALLAQPLYASEPGSADVNPYMGAPVALGKAPNGAIANQKLLDGIDKVSWSEPTIEQPVEGIWVFGGYGLAPISVIDTDEGLILFDTGDTKHDGELLLEALRTVSDKPVKAIIYGHSHTCMGAGVLAEGNEDVMIIDHPGLNAMVEQNAKAAGAPAYFQELGPYLTARMLIQFNAFMPSEGPDAWVVPTNLTSAETAFLPINTPVEDEQVMTVLGEKMQFFTRYGSDDKVHTTVWLPDRKIVFTTLLWSGPPQLYSLRGDVFRDPREWIAGLKLTRDLEPEVLISAAARPVVGKEEIRERLEGYLDGACFVLDQTLRGILGGDPALLAADHDLDRPALLLALALEVLALPLLRLAQQRRRDVETDHGRTRTTGHGPRVGARPTANLEDARSRNLLHLGRRAQAVSEPGRIDGFAAATRVSHGAPFGVPQGGGEGAPQLPAQVHRHGVEIGRPPHHELKTGNRPRTGITICCRTQN